MPMRAFFICVWRMRLMSPCACIWTISSQRCVLSSVREGTKGMGLKLRSILVSLGSWLSVMRLVGMRFASPKLDSFSLSQLRRSKSTSAVIRLDSRLKRSFWARVEPYSLMMQCPPKTVSVLDSPTPAEAYTYAAIQRALCVRTNSSL